jgi:arylsulfatase A-like enzyme
MVEISLSGSGEGLGWATARGYSTAARVQSVVRRSWVGREVRVRVSGGRFWLLILLVLAGSACSGGGEGSDDLVDLLPPRPGSNVIVVSFDALRPDALGSYGYPLQTSPAIDAFAAEAVQFENAYAAAPKTPTSFAGAFTGRHPSRVFRNWRLKTKQTLAALFHAAGYRTAAFVNNPQLVARRGFNQGFAEYRVYTDAADEHVLADVRRWLTENNDDRLFLWVHFIDPHAPWVRRPVAERLYDADYAGRFVERAEKLLALHDEDELLRVRSLYDGEVLSSDRRFAELMATLREQGLLDNSFVVLTSDHGEEFMEHGHMQHGWLNEENLHIPLLIRHPDRGRGGHRTRRVSNIDLLPTLAALAGLEAPGELDGSNLLVPATEGGLLGEGAPFVAVANTNRKLQAAAIRVGDAELVVYCGRRRGRELFDLASDPGERQDLSAERPEEADALAIRLWTTLSVDGCADLAMDRRRGLSRKRDGLTPRQLEALQSLGYIEE